MPCQLRRRERPRRPANDTVVGVLLQSFPGGLNLNYQKIFALFCFFGVSATLGCGGGDAPTPVSPPVEIVEDLRTVEDLTPELDTLRRQVAETPQDAEARRELGRALHTANFKELAAEQFEAIVAIEPTPRALRELALAYTDIGRFDDAAATYARLLEQQPNDPIALHNLGNLAFRRDDFDLAIDYYEQALAHDPQYLLARRHLGDALKSAERYKDAYRAYEQVLAIQPDNASEASGYIDALYQLASLALMMGAYDRAGAFLSEVLQADPNHPAAYYAYGQVLLQLGRPGEAQQAFDRHVALLEQRKPTGPVATGE